MKTNEISLHNLRCQGDRIMVSVLWLMLLLSFALAGWYQTWMEAFTIGLPAALVPSLLYFLQPGALITRLSIATACMVFAALQIHQGHGMIELHFAIFVLLAFLLCYRDWMPIITAAVVIAVHHLSFSYLQQWGYQVYVFEMRLGFNIVLIHAAYVVFETIVLVYFSLQSRTESVQAEEISQIGKHLALINGSIDLTFRKENANSEFAQGINEYMDVIHRVIGNTHYGAAELLSAANELSRGNVNLSQRTETQASSLRETAANMDEMTETVKQNADSAQQAMEFASAASSQAQDGGEVMTNAVSAMQGINESSEKIANIVNVIDDIAFQTNLLALNAAIEAARAGDQGRGFAVVASEVRNLAQRSAVAAGEIKGLINSSVDKIGAGTSLVEQSGQMLASIVESVTKVSGIVSEIANASLQQSEGIIQVNQTITEMENITQQNASLVEQVSAASEVLVDQARNLSQEVMVFKIGADNTAAG